MSGPGRTLALIEDLPRSEERLVILRGEIDVGSTETLRDWISRASDGGQRSIVVDISHVEFMAVSGLHVLCEEQTRLARHRARLTVVGAGPRIRQLFDVCRLNGVIHVVASRSALAARAWDADDDARTMRLEQWMSRYATAGRSTSPAG